MRQFRRSLTPMLVFACACSSSITVVNIHSDGGAGFATDAVAPIHDAPPELTDVPTSPLLLDLTERSVGTAQILGVASTGAALAALVGNISVEGARLVRFDAAGRQLDTAPLDVIAGGAKGVIRAGDGFLVWNDRFARLVPPSGAIRRAAIRRPTAAWPITTPTTFARDGFVWITPDDHGVPLPNVTIPGPEGSVRTAIVVPTFDISSAPTRISISDTYRVATASDPFTGVTKIWWARNDNAEVRQVSIDPHVPAGMRGVENGPLVDHRIEGDVLHLLSGEVLRGTVGTSRVAARFALWRTVDLRDGSHRIAQMLDTREGATPISGPGFFVHGQFLEHEGELLAKSSVDDPRVMRRRADGTHEVMSGGSFPQNLERMIPLASHTVYLTPWLEGSMSGVIRRVSLTSSTPETLGSYAYRAYPNVTAQLSCAATECVALLDTTYPFYESSTQPAAFRVHRRTHAMQSLANIDGAFIGRLDDGELVFTGIRASSGTTSPNGWEDRRIPALEHEARSLGEIDATRFGLPGVRPEQRYLPQGFRSATDGACAYHPDLTSFEIGTLPCIRRTCPERTSRPSERILFTTPRGALRNGGGVAGLAHSGSSIIAIVADGDANNSSVGGEPYAARFDAGATTATLQRLDAIPMGFGGGYLSLAAIAANREHVVTLFEDRQLSTLAVYMANAATPHELQALELGLRPTDVTNRASVTLTSFDTGFLLSYTNIFSAEGLDQREHWLVTIGNDGVSTGRQIELPAGATLRTHWTDGTALYVIVTLESGLTQLREIPSPPN